MKKYANGAVIAQIRYNLDGQKTELDDVKDTGGKIRQCTSCNYLV